MLKRLLCFSIALSGCLVTYTVHAVWAPRVTGLGEIGEHGSLWGDGLFPVQDITNQVVFFDFQAEANRFYSGNTTFSGILSPGLGMRHAFSNDNVLGLYVFSDYMKTNAQQNYWFVSPGVDFYHGPWYAALNGYIPVNNAPRAIGSGSAASDLGITQHEVLTGNSQYDYLVQTFATMRWGMDLTGGVLFGERNEWAVKLGAYEYDAQQLNTIRGGRGELDYYFNDNVALILEERYDNVFYNQTLVGVKISFLGKENRGTVPTQLKAPIYRNLNINTTSAGTPIGEYQQASSQSYLIRDNITFVSNEPGLTNAQLTQAGMITGDGTYENPYTGLDQATIDSITKMTSIWVEGTGTSHPYSDASTLTLHTGQAIYGRTDGFKVAALDAATQPVFNFAPSAGIAALYIDNTNTLEHIIMHGNGAADSRGVQVGNTGSGTALINGVTIGTTATATGYATALYNQGGHVAINDASLYAIENTVNVSSTGPTAQGAFGIYNDGGTIAVTNSTVSATANNVNYASDAVGTGISGGALGAYNTNGGVITIDQSQVGGNATNVSYQAGSSIMGGDLVGAFGVYNTGGTVTLTNSSVQARADNVVDTRTPASANFSMIGAFGLYNTNGTLTVTGSSSSINAIATGVDNQGYDSNTYQGLLDYVGAFGAYNDGGGNGNTATLAIQQTHLMTSATTVANSLFTLNDPAISAIGVRNNGNEGTATATVEQGAQVDVNATWQIASTTSSNSAVNALGLYNEGMFGIGNLTANAATVNVTETGGDGSGAGMAAGVANGALEIGSNSSAVTVITGATQIYASGTGDNISVYGFYNSGNYESTDGTIITGGSIIDSLGGTSGSSIAVYNAIGSMSIQGTADQHIILSAANGGGANNGVWNDNGGRMAINYATISAGPATAGNYSLGLTNTNGSTVTMQQTTVTVTAASGSNAYGVYNQRSSATISDSTFNVTTSGTGVAYGLADDGQGAGIVINSPTALNINYDVAAGNAYAFSIAGIYAGENNVTCKYNGAPSPCTTG